ncbi:NUDIX domain-containing protein [Actinomadura verrucosospora]|uniref:NUDIX hydrolase n=1 Tax=Actinomadura verrucosospora TaxID=46165 RepID=A0A7D3W5X0_ACTVE|nr:NUDIX hydrolase [Actinomadura verrucosospora]QKG27172.1 NUDIX hydrolase [Actinomadura verrucosospora]
MAWTEPAAWFEQLPACYLATGMLLTDPRGRVLLVKTHYRPDWGLPGGVAEDNEPPHLACAREIYEELGLDRPAGPLLAVDFVAADGDRLRPMLYLIFDGGTLDDPAITMQEDEIADFDLFPDSAASLMTTATSHRLPRALTARRTGRVTYLAHSS